MVGKRRRERANRRVETVCLLILTLIASGVALALLQPVLVPFVLALFFTYCLAPIIDFQMRWFRVPRGVAVFGAGAIGLALAILLGILVAASVGTMSNKFHSYQERFHTLGQRLGHAELLRRFRVNLDPAAGGLIFSIPENATVSLVSSILGETTNILAHSALVVIFMIFILLGRSETERPASGLLAEIESRVKRYVGQTVFLSVFTGLVVAAILGVLGVEFAAVFGFLAFLFNFIPSVGAVIATLLPLPIILLSPELSPTAKILAFALPGGVQFAIGLIQPKVQGGALELHPVVVLMALIFFGMIWGLVGAFLATPIAGVIKIIFERIEATRPLAAAMSGNLDLLSVRVDEATAPRPARRVPPPQEPVSRR